MTFMDKQETFSWTSCGSRPRVFDNQEPTYP